MLRLEGETRRALVNFLSQVEILQSGDGRRQVLKNAHLGRLWVNIERGATIKLAVGNIVDFLANWGAKDGQQALVLFLNALMHEVGEDGQENLKSFIATVSSSNQLITEPVTVLEGAPSQPPIADIVEGNTHDQLEVIRDLLALYSETLSDPALAIEANPQLQAKVVSGLETLLKHVEDLQERSKGILSSERASDLLNQIANKLHMCAKTVKCPPKDESARAKVYRGLSECLKYTDTISAAVQERTATLAESQNQDEVNQC